IIWISLILLIGIFAFLTYFCITRYNSLSTPVNETRFLVNTTNDRGPFPSIVSRDADMENTTADPKAPEPGNPLKLATFYFHDALKSKIEEKLALPGLWLFFSIVVTIILVILLVAVLTLASRIN